jgi:hypothetical protein
MYAKSRRVRHYNVVDSFENGLRRSVSNLNRSFYRSSPNLLATSKYDFSDDDNDDYGFLKVNHRKPIHLAPKIPPLPKDYQEQLLYEQKQRQYWENIQQRIVEFCRSRHGTSNSMATKAKEKQQQHSSLQTSYNTKSQRNLSVPLQPANSSDSNRKVVKDKFGSDKVKKKNTCEDIDFVDDADSTEEEAEKFLKNYEKLLEEDDFENSYSHFENPENPLCVKCLVQFFNNQSTSTMSRVSLPSICFSIVKFFGIVSNDPRLISIKILD